MTDGLDYLIDNVASLRALMVTDLECRDVATLSRATALRDIDLLQSSADLANLDSRALSPRSVSARWSLGAASLVSCHSVERLMLAGSNAAIVNTLGGSNITHLALTELRRVDWLKDLQLRRLEALEIHGKGVLDLNQIPASECMRSIRIDGFSQILGIGEIAGRGNLEHLTICDAKQVGPVEELRKLKLSYFLGVGPAFVDSAVRAGLKTARIQKLVLPPASRAKT